MSVIASGARAIRRLLSTEDSLPVREVLASGVLPTLIALLASPDGRVAFEAAWAVTNIASTEYTSAVVEAGALAPLAAGMMHGDAAVRDQCIWCLGNVAGDRPAFRDAVLGTAGAVEALLTNLRHPENIKLLRNATWTLSNFCRGKPAVAPAAVAPLLPALAYLATSDDAAVAADALWGLCFLTDCGGEALIDALLAAPGLLARIVATLGAEDCLLVNPALRIVGNLVSSVERHTQAAVDAGALPALVPLLGSARRAIKREACWAVSNVAAGSHGQIGAALATRGLLPAVLEAMRAGDWAVRKEAAWIICNAAAAGAAEHVCALVAGGVVEPLVAVLATDDARMITVVLDAVAAILAVETRFKAAGNPAAALCRFAEQFEAHGAVGRLEELQEHASTEVYDKAYAILAKHYAEDGEGGEGEGAQQPGGVGAGAAENAAAVVAQAGGKLFGAATPHKAAAPAPYAFAGMTFA